jgi:hypothetical protein
MTKHTVEYSYSLPEWASIEVDLDPLMDKADKEAIAEELIRETFDDIDDIEITKITEIG